MDNEPILLVLEEERPASWNDAYSGQHWTTRGGEAGRVHLLMKKFLRRGKMFTKPVDITMTVYFKGNMQDCDNICDKYYIDGLKNMFITNDNPTYVASTKTISRKDNKRPRVEILIEMVQEPLR